MQSLPPNVAGGVVYQPGAPPSYPGTFSPAGSVEGSPMHNMYMNQPGQTAPPQYQAMPAAAPGEKTFHGFTTMMIYHVESHLVRKQSLSGFGVLLCVTEGPLFLQIPTW